MATNREGGWILVRVSVWINLIMVDAGNGRRRVRGPRVASPVLGRGGEGEGTDRLPGAGQPDGVHLAVHGSDGDGVAHLRRQRGIRRPRAQQQHVRLDGRSRPSRRVIFWSGFEVVWVVCLLT